MAIATLLASITSPAAAQIISRDFPQSLPGYESDLTLPMQQDDPNLQRGQGIRLGDFVVQPQLTENTGYNTDPLGNRSGGSSLLGTDASLLINSDWRRDALAASFNVDDTRYFDKPIASATDWTAGVGGGLDFLGSRWDFAYTHLQENLGPQQLGTVGVTAPVPYGDDDFRFDDDLVLGRIRLIPSLDYSSYNFGHAAGGGLDGPELPAAAASYSGLNRQILAPTLTGLLELSKARSLVALIRYTDAQYGTPSLGSIDNSYSDILGFVGVDLEADAVIRLRALIGGETRAFRSSAQEGRTTPAAQIDTDWQPTRLTKVSLVFTRGLVDAATVYAGSAVVTDGRIEIDHALRRNVELKAYADVGASDYRTGTLLDADGSQLQESFGGTVAWTPDRHVVLTMSYANLRTRYDTTSVGSSPIDLSSQTTNIVTVGVTLSD